MEQLVQQAIYHWILDGTPIIYSTISECTGVILYSLYYIIQETNPLLK